MNAPDLAEVTLAKVVRADDPPTRREEPAPPDPPAADAGDDDDDDDDGDGDYGHRVAFFAELELTRGGVAVVALGGFLAGVAVALLASLAR